MVPARPALLRQLGVISATALVISNMIGTMIFSWQKLRVVSFAYPLIPVVFLMVGLWMTIRGIQLKPIVSLATVVTVATGALVYHIRLRTRESAGSTVETY